MYLDSKGRKTAVICVCPVKNEAWIIERFLTLASQWADYIVVADQMSDDGTTEILKNHEKVIYVYNDGEFNEQARSTLLLNEVRKIKADKKLVFCLDADEALTLNWNNSEEWNLMLEAEPKTIFEMPWINLLPHNKDYGLYKGHRKFAYVDDNISSFNTPTLSAPR